MEHLITSGIDVLGVALICIAGLFIIVTPATPPRAVRTR